MRAPPCRCPLGLGASQQLWWQGRRCSVIQGCQGTLCYPREEPRPQRTPAALTTEQMDKPPTACIPHAQSFTVQVRPAGTGAQLRCELPRRPRPRPQLPVCKMAPWLPLSRWVQGTCTRGAVSLMSGICPYS